MLAAGAIGYILKDSEPEQLLSAIRAAASGQVPIDPRVAGALLPSRSDPADVLSDREVQVLRLVSSGLANKQIARQLGIAERTVKVHLGNVFRRIGVTDRTSAALWARDHLHDGMVPELRFGRLVTPQDSAQSYPDDAFYAMRLMLTDCGTGTERACQG